MSILKRRRFPVEIILLCVRWYCKYGISYRDLAKMMSGARCQRQSKHDLSLGSALCSGDREADPALPGTSLRLLESGRDLVFDGCCGSFPQHEAGIARTRRKTEVCDVDSAPGLTTRPS